MKINSAPCKCFDLKILITVFLCSVFSICNSQNSIEFERLTTSDGLSQSDINCIYQDDDGFMWFGTFDGLNRYDGYQFKNYLPEVNNHGSISSNIVFAITGDKTGNLWVGTTGGGLNRFNKKTGIFTRFEHNENDSNTIDSDYITSVCVDKKNRLWVGTVHGINILDLTKKQESPVFKHLETVNNKPVKTIHEDSSGNIWVAFANELFKVEEDNISFKLVKIRSFNGSVNYIGQNESGELVVGAYGGVYIKNNSSIKSDIEFTRIIKTYPQSLAVDKNVYWVGTEIGLRQFEYSKKTKKFEEIGYFVYDPLNPKSISKNIIKALFKDKTGIIWIGTNGGGINKFDSNKKKFKHVRRTSNPHSLSYDKIRSFYEDSQDNFWVGTEGGGLNLLRREDNDGNYDKFKVYLDRAKPFALEEVTINEKQFLLVGSGYSGALYRLEIDTVNKTDNLNFEIILKTNGAIFSLLQDSNKTIWVGTYNGGVYRLIPNGDDFKIDVFKHSINDTNSLPNDIIRSIYQDSKGDVWFGTGNGLSRLHASELLKDKPKFKSYIHKEDDRTSISHNYIMPIYETEKGELFVGTFGGGLNKYMPATQEHQEGFKSYGLKDGLPNKVIKSILEDGSGNLWVSTNKGLSKFNPNTETFKNYDENDGLQDSEFQELAGIKRSNGELVFGGINGFNVFNPREIKDNIEPPETVITQFSLFNEEVEIGEAYNGKVLLDSAINYTQIVNLDYSQNSFSFGFAGLHFAASKKNKFAYILEGYDKDWVKTNSAQRFANYTNIPPGLYTFKVKSSNGDGIWDISPARIDLKIKPPFWLTNWAYLLYTLGIIGLLIGFRRYTVISTTKKHQFELEHLEKEQKEELQRVKLEFFTNVSHEFRTPLTLIKGPLDYLLESETTKHIPEVQEQAKIMRKNTDYLMRLVNQLLDFRKINQGKMRLVLRHTDIISFIRDIAEPFQFTAHNQNINLKIGSSYKKLKTWFDHDAFEKIMKNILSNAFKFTPEKGEISIEISKEIFDIDQVVIMIKNTSIDISEEEISNIFERFYSKPNKNKKFQRGSGIGLAFTQSLINVHQGTIEAKLEEENLINFIIRLPLHKSAYENLPEISIKEETESDFLIRSSEQESFAIDMNDEITDAEIMNKRSKLPVLLVVDDNSDIRTFIKRALSKDFKVFEASNGQEGLEKAFELIPNIIITDVLMPIMDGIELCNHLKFNNNTSHIPVIMLTAKSSKESEIEGLEIGADAYIKKPFDLNVLKLKLANILKHRAELRKRFNREITLQPEEVVVTSLDEKFLQRAIEIVEKHMMNTDFSVELLVKEMGLSRSHLYIKFKELTGLSSSAFIRNIRLKRAVQLLEQSDFSVKEIMYMTGFNTSSYFSQCFKKQFGVLPRDYIKKLKEGKDNLGGQDLEQEEV
ncbi:response regulator [Tamlana fucoidanivorans]|uniref:histidine kinase n=1 Tax=Allotamlana fucoidanivorans TaxID=2583814 RepID=A0A5C4SID6_9FLAO|nr:two-component regulator propeller domain-containing protein [Tamlana fucoidanivorans]TNJ43436.1 response regulator [Tamlana fucoidanivorans]